MGLVTTTGNFCYIQCDRINCNRKMEHVNTKLLKELARLCGWDRRGRRWTCPDCAEKAGSEKGLRVRQKSSRARIEA